MRLSATFQFTIVSFKLLYLVGFSLKLGEIDLDGNIRKSSFMCLMFEENWSYHLGDMVKKVQHIQTVTVFAASGKWLLLAYYPMT